MCINCNMLQHLIRSGRRGNLISISRVFFARKEYDSDSKTFQKNRSSNDEEEDKHIKFNESSYKKTIGRDVNKNLEVDKKKEEEDDDDRFDVYRTNTVWASRDGSAFGYRYVQTTVPRNQKEDGYDEYNEYEDRKDNRKKLDTENQKRDTCSNENEQNCNEKMDDSKRNRKYSQGEDRCDSISEEDRCDNICEEESSVNRNKDNKGNNAHDYEAKSEREKKETKKDKGHPYQEFKETKRNDKYDEEHESLANDEGFGFGIYTRKVQYYYSDNNDKSYDRNSTERKNYKEESKQSNMKNNRSWGKSSKKDNWGNYSYDKQANKNETKGSFGHEKH